MHVVFDASYKNWRASKGFRGGTQKRVKVLSEVLITKKGMPMFGGKYEMNVNRR
jgi:hypothetical protein